MGSIPTRSRHLPSPVEARLSTFVILNPAAGHGRSGRFREAVVRAAEAAWGEVELATTGAPGEAQALARGCVGRTERVIAVGGDGTVHEVANGLLAGGATPPPLGVVPVGTGNDFAKLTGTAGLAPGRAIAALASATTRRFDAGTAWGEHFINSLGIGLDADVARRVNEYKHWPGALGYVVAALQALVHRRALRLHVEVDGERWSGPTTLFEVGIGHSTGGVFFLVPDAKPDDGLLDICAVGTVSLGFLLTRATRVLRGTHTTLSEVRMARGTQVRITSDDGPLTAHLDGELRAPGTNVLEIGVRPGALPVLVADARGRAA
ncbi:MAG TPA: diacylglycerol kinase family protein [Gemmatimonadales bacterium]|nr:diacylglycerol kinase family protein [Gemmatimonadales bacterium]